MGERKPSRAVTRRCVACERKFTAKRKDARYCSGKCRQAANRARAAVDLGDIDRQIDAAKATYWGLLRRKAEARGVNMSRVVTEEAQFVDEDGDVYIRGKHVGHTIPHRPGWSAWGLEAAGPPWSPPTDWADKQALGGGRDG